MIFHDYPYTNFHDLNLDWILKMMKQLDKEMDDFTALNKISFMGAWNPARDYPAYAIVTDSEANGYISLKVVPKNVLLSDESYWVRVSDYASIYQEFIQRVNEVESEMSALRTQLTGEINSFENQINSDVAGIGSNLDTLQQQTASNFQSVSGQLSALSSRMDSFTNLPSGSTSGDAELQDIRIAYNGQVYSSAGAAVRGQINGVYSAINRIATLVQPQNLYNKNSSLNHLNYLAQAGGALVALSGSSVSHPIKCTPGMTYCFKMSAGWYGTATNTIVRFCDANGNIDTGSSAFINATAAGGNAYAVFTMPSNPLSEYVAVNVRMQDADSMIFAQGSTLPAYSPYFEPYYVLASDVDFNDRQKAFISSLSNDPLYGKKAAFTGDSICNGASGDGGYPYYIGQNHDMQISNIAQDGGTLSRTSGRFCISESVANMPADYDYYIFEGGVNDADASTGATLGTISYGYTAELDLSTVCGAVEHFAKQVQTLYKGKKYGFIFPHNTYGPSSVWNTGWRNTIKECLKKWGIPYLDLSEECAQLRNIDALRIYTVNGDGWHPTAEGYELYYVPKIEAWMKTL